jgi:hypothetical protein
MDSISHALWSSFIARGINLNLKSKEKLNIWFIAFWGMFPDIFAFAIPLIAVCFGLIRGKVHLLGWPYPGISSLESTMPLIYKIIGILYHISHSLIVFIFIFILVTIILRKPILAMSFWGLHILIDIPTHNGNYPTPFLWPFSDFTINGISWKLPLLIIINYSLLLIAYMMIKRKEYALRKQRGKRK